MPLTGSGSFPAIALPNSIYLSGVAVVFNHLDGCFPEVGKSNPAFHIWTHWTLSLVFFMSSSTWPGKMLIGFPFPRQHPQRQMYVSAKRDGYSNISKAIYDQNLETTLKEIQVDRLMQGFRPQKKKQAYHKYRNAWLQRLSYSCRSICGELNSRRTTTDKVDNFEVQWHWNLDSARPWKPGKTSKILAWGCLQVPPNTWRDWQQQQQQQHSTY